MPLVVLSKVVGKKEAGESCPLTHSSPRRSSPGLSPSGPRLTTVSGGSPRTWLQAQSTEHATVGLSTNTVQQQKKKKASNTAKEFHYSESERSDKRSQSVRSTIEELSTNKKKVTRPQGAASWPVTAGMVWPTLSSFREDGRN